jgi:hypothetical protein
MTLRGLYPRLIHAEQDPRDLRRELHGVLSGLGRLQILAALVPLAGAALQLVLTPGEFTLGFRLLVTALIGAGVLGLGVAVYVTQHLRHLVMLFTSPAVHSDLPLRRETFE